MWRKRQRRYKNHAFNFSGKLFPFIGILGIVLLLIVVFKLGIFNVKIVEVTGVLGCVDNQGLVGAANISGQNFFIVDKEKITQKLKEKFFCINRVDVSRIFPSKVVLKVENRQPAAILAVVKIKEATTSSVIDNIASPSAYEVTDNFVIDNEGVVFSKGLENLGVPKIFANNLTLSLGERLADSFMNSLIILEKVKKLGQNVNQSWIEGDFFVVISGTDLKIIFRSNYEINVQLASLQLILDKAKIDSSELEFIDLRFDKPTVRFAPKKK